jgi:osmotically-inducible protein OsmY
VAASVSPGGGPGRSRAATDPAADGAISGAGRGAPDARQTAGVEVGQVDTEENEALRDRVRERLLADERAGRAVQRGVAVAVAARVVTVVGYVRTRSLAVRIVQLTGALPGVAGVDDRLIADAELAREVGAAIARTPLNRASRPTVRVEDGHIRLGGSFPTPEARSEAVRASHRVPGVRSVAEAE